MLLKETRHFCKKEKEKEETRHTIFDRHVGTNHLYESFLKDIKIWDTTEARGKLYTSKIFLCIIC
jgi:hypothetical protein